jgi:hypothetical protein
MVGSVVFYTSHVFTEPLRSNNGEDGEKKVISNASFHFFFQQYGNWVKTNTYT